ncbi:CMRF35-like molecule 5 [Dissostichus eleginoides]|uniref:CMRF35-like molecule 5 n=1 Tax=Dissostichus eleginoides TaxID=100907 RepID=A0AAD9CAY1_DISEL|nr:CMRF35-like molecule 5 [Dissostichus eleginoides]
MKTLVLLLLHASLQLQCDKKQITAPLGSDFLLSCSYENQLLSNKYWCRGESRTTCEVLVDSEGKTRSTRVHIVDVRRRGLFVRVVDLQKGDSGVYWVGIDRPYADIMTSVSVVVTEVPVSKPRLQPLVSLIEGSTCRGGPVTVRVCSRGTAVRYSWFRHTHPEDVLLQNSADLRLTCDSLQLTCDSLQLTCDSLQDAELYCSVRNEVSSERSESLRVNILPPADSHCRYVVHMPGQPVYDCAVSTTAQTNPPTSCHTTGEIQPDTTNQLINATETHLLLRVFTGVPLWYTMLRWGSFASLVIFICVFITCAKVRDKHAKRKRRRRRERRVGIRGRPQSAG